MSSCPPSAPSRLPPPAAREGPGEGRVFLDGPRAALAALGGIVGVALIAALDHATGSRFSFSLFYLLPVAACAWWGGLSYGVLLSLAGTAAWHWVDAARETPGHFMVLACNGVIRFGTLTLVSSLVSRLRAGISRERLLARTDALTGAANGRTFYAEAAAAAERAGRAGRPLTLAYLDLDNFKQLNDRLGHAAGDAALWLVARTVRQNLRQTDLLARLGGDEFAVLLPDAGAEAEAILTRVRERVSEEMAGHGWPVTLSVGAITFLRPPADVDQMVRRVDALMYRAKRAGKNRLQHETEGDMPAPARSGPERRATARVVGACPARVTPAGEPGAAEEFATVRDISSSGVGLTLQNRMADGTLLLIEPFASGPRPLLGRVVRVVAEEGGWRHGCELSTRLSDEEVRCWMGPAGVARVGRRSTPREPGRAAEVRD